VDHDPAAVLAYVWGELDPDANERFERHLVDCDLCWAAVREDAYGRAAAEAGRESVAPLVRDRTRFAVEAESRRISPASRRPGRNVVALAAIVIFASTALWVAHLGRPGHAADPPPVAAVIHLVGQAGAGLGAAPAARLVADGQVVSVTRLELNGSPVLLARSERPFPTPAGAQPMPSEDVPWVASRGPFTLVCFNRPHPVLLTARLPATQLTPLAARLAQLQGTA
jgi:hypothetical protein